MSIREMIKIAFEQAMAEVNANKEEHVYEIGKYKTTVITYFNEEGQALQTVTKSELVVTDEEALAQQVAYLEAKRTEAVAAENFEEAAIIHKQLQELKKPK